MTQTTITYLGHTGLLITSDQVRFVIDPNFSSKVVSLKRQQPSAHLQYIDQLHQVNAILYTNAHHHRLDTKSLGFFKQTAQLVLPLGLGSVIPKVYRFHQTELKDGAELHFGDCYIRAIKARHRGFRKSGLTHKACLNYLIKTPTGNIFYCSDSAYEGAYFYDIGQEFKIDVAILPIDHVGPDFSAGKRYMTAKQALQAFGDLQASQMVPNCYGAFSFSGHKIDKILAELNQQIAEQDLQSKVKVLQPGEIFCLES